MPESPPAAPAPPALPGVARTIPATEAQNAFGQVLDAVTAGQVVAVTRHNAVRAVVVPIDRYRQLVAHEAGTLEALGARFEALYARMQDAAVRAATATAVDASPEEMGRAAVAAAERRRASSA
jgi:prevent-host-death family protein